MVVVIPFDIEKTRKQLEDFDYGVDADPKKPNPPKPKP